MSVQIWTTALGVSSRWQQRRPFHVPNKQIVVEEEQRQEITWHDTAAPATSSVCVCVWGHLTTLDSWTSRAAAASAVSSPTCWPSSTDSWTGSGPSSGRRRWSWRWSDFSPPEKPRSLTSLRWVFEEEYRASEPWARTSVILHWVLIKPLIKAMCVSTDEHTVTVGPVGVANAVVTVYLSNPHPLKH